MQTLSWQKLRFLKFINSFFNPFWWKGKAEKLKERKDDKRVLAVDKALLQPFAWKERPLWLYYFSSFTAYLFTPSPLTPFRFPPYSFLLPSILLTSYSFSPYYSPLLSLLLTTSLLPPSLLITYSFPPSLLTPYSFSPYYLLLLSLLLPRLFFKPIHQPLQLLGDG